MRSKVIGSKVIGSKVSGLKVIGSKVSGSSMPVRWTPEVLRGMAIVYFSSLRKESAKQGYLTRGVSMLEKMLRSGLNRATMIPDEVE